MEASSVFYTCRYSVFTGYDRFVHLAIDISFKLNKLNRDHILIYDIFQHVTIALYIGAIES